MNCDVNEAIATFSTVARNCTAMRKLGVQIDEGMGTCEKVAAVRKVLNASSRNAKTLGQWTAAASDASKLNHLVQHGIVSNANASKQTVLFEMQTYLEKSGMKPYKTPRAVMQQIMTHINIHVNTHSRK